MPAIFARVPRPIRRRAVAAALLAPITVVSTVTACNESASAAPTAPAAPNANVAHAPGAGAAKGPGGGGGAAVTTVTADGVGLGPASAMQFLAPVATVTLAESRLLSVTSEKALGSIAVGGGTGMRLTVCYRAASGSIVAARPEIAGLRVAAGTRAIFSRAAAFTLPAGTYDVGLCGYSTNASSWNDSGVGSTTVLIHPAG